MLGWCPVWSCTSEEASQRADGRRQTAGPAQSGRLLAQQVGFAASGAAGVLSSAAVCKDDSGSRSGVSVGGVATVEVRTSEASLESLPRFPASA